MPADDLGRWSAKLSDHDVRVRSEAARRLVAAGELATGSVLALLVAVADDDEIVASLATEALENLASPRATEVGEIVKFVAAGNGESAYWAATLLGRLRDDAAFAVPALTAAVASHPAESVRERAAWALGRIGSAADSSREVLRRATQSGTPRLARLAREALEQIETSSSH